MLIYTLFVVVMVFSLCLWSLFVRVCVLCVGMEQYLELARKLDWVL